MFRLCQIVFCLAFNDRRIVVAVGKDEMSPIVLPFTQSLPVAKLDLAISELDAVCYAGLTVPASRAGVGESGCDRRK